MTTMNRRLLLLLPLALLLAVAVAACGGQPAAETTKSAVTVGPVTINKHPASLEGKTVVLRWNSKPNGDKLLSRVAELLTEKVPGVKVIKLWEQDKSTAVLTEDQAASEALAKKIAALKPDLVIASQAD